MFFLFFEDLCPVLLFLFVLAEQLLPVMVVLIPNVRQLEVPHDEFVAILFGGEALFPML